MRLALFMMFMFTFGALAAPKLPNFKPGLYQRVDGPAEKCRGGRFAFIDGHTVAFGEHPFDTLELPLVFPSDIPQERGCTYDARSKVSVQGDETRLGFVETLRCPTGVRHVLNRLATLKGDQVRIEVDLQGNSAFTDEPSEQYSCVFALKPLLR